MSMDPSLILDRLNDRQRESVAAPLGNQLILAGAGSGKTRVLIHRIAWLNLMEQANLHSILAVTFTNKAAGEMRHRLEEMTGQFTQRLWVGTFHGLSHRILRAHWREAGLPENFQILDSDDQLRLIKRVMRELDVDDQKWPPRQVQGFINAKKDQGLRPNNIPLEGDIYARTLKPIYSAYEHACVRSGVLDFADLLLRSLELLQNDLKIQSHYHERFQHILVDEFQDTNGVQYQWMKQLSGGSESLMVVGDDDQSIYGWRGAKIDNIDLYVQEFSPVNIVRLEQNYRSTQTILNAANAVISNNQGRMGKELWTHEDAGEPILLYAAYNEHDEARYIVETIEQYLRKGSAKRSEIAILYRSNAQSRVIEEFLVKESIPYRIYGGQRFFERAEIKNALAYLRIIRHRDDDAAFERIINLPTRGLGEKTLNEIREHARTENTSMWRASVRLLDQRLLTGRAANALHLFIEMIDTLALITENMPLSLATEKTIHTTGLMDFHRQEKGEKGQTRVENLQELVGAAKSFEEGETPETAMAAFLDHTVLESGENQGSDFEDCVQLMTLHSAKGLEFSLVFLAGLEEGLFPHKMSLDEHGRLEEERRLAYVGITRAMQRLILTYAETRRLFGSETQNKVSRFVREIPTTYLQEVRLSNTVSRPTNMGWMHSPLAHKPTHETPFRLGQRVNHPLFGEGIVLRFEGAGAQTRVQVNFNHEGSKWLVLTYAKLQGID